MMVPVLIAALTVAASPVPQQAADPQLTEWINAATAHRPGAIDPPLLEIAQEQPAFFEEIRKKIASLLERQVPSLEERNAILRRGALLHTDIALLLPEEASAFTQIPVPGSASRRGTTEVDSIFLATDGQFEGTVADTAHWWFASEVLRRIRPDPGADAFVARWHRAVIAHFEGTGSFGRASFAIPRALVVLPDDPVIRMYAGALHDATASDQMQAVRRGGQVNVRNANAELKLAEAEFRRSVDGGGPPEALVRLGRVLGALGRHAEAAEMLLAAQKRFGTPEDPRLIYFAALFHGTEQMALGHLDAARQQFGVARAAAPRAQSAMIALADACFKGGQHACAAGTLRDLEALESIEDQHRDPWVRYYIPLAADGDDQMEQLRNSLSNGNGRW